MLLKKKITLAAVLRKDSRGPGTKQRAEGSLAQQTSRRGSSLATAKGQRKWVLGEVCLQAAGGSNATAAGAHVHVCKRRIKAAPEFSDPCDSKDGGLYEKRTS